MKMLYQPASSYVRQDSEEAVFVPLQGRSRFDCLAYLSGIALHGCGTAESCIQGGGGFDDAFMDTEVYNLIDFFLSGTHL